MFTVIWRSIRDRKTSLIVFMVTAMLFMWMYVALFPSIAKQADAFNAVFENFPPAVFAIFGIEDLNMSTMESFLSAEHFSLVLPIMLIFLLISVAGRSIAGEIEQGTMELLIGRPVSRLKIILSKYISGMGVLAVFTIIAVLSVIPFAALHGVDYEIRSYAAGGVIIFLFGWAIFSMTMMFSAMFSEKSKVYMAAGGVLLGMYVLNIVTLLNANLDVLKYFSFFHYYAYADALIRQSLYGAGCVVLISSSIVFTAAGFLWFCRRDIAV